MYRAIMQSILRGNIGRLDLLLQQEADFNAVTESDEWNLLHRALVFPSRPPAPELIRRLIERGVNVNARDSYGNTPLHYAARSKKPELIDVLLRSGAEIDPVNRDGLTPLRLMLLSKPVNLQSVELFLSRGANPNQKKEGGITVREYAQRISHGDNRAIIELFEKYSDGTRTK